MNAREKGWSLLETMAAMLLVGLGVALFVKIMAMSGRSNAANTNLLKAGQLIEKQIDIIRAAVAQNPAANWPPTASTCPSSTTSGVITFTCAVSAAASPKNNTNLPNVRLIAFKAWWTGTGQTDTVIISTYVSKNF